MNWYITPYTILAWGAAVIAVGIALFTWRRRTLPGRIAFVGLMAAAGWWSFCYALELASTHLATMIFLAQLEYIGIVLVPVFLLLFVLLYTGRVKQLDWRTLLALFVLPLLTLILVFTNAFHHLIWQETLLDSQGPFVALVVSYGWWFWIHIAYAYLTLLSSAVLMLSFLLRSHALYRGQVLALLAGVSMPWLGNLVYVLKLVPVPHLDLTPVSFVLSGCLLAIGVFRFRLLDIAPVARRALVDSMEDAMVAYDLHGRVVDANVATESLTGYPVTEIVGRALEDVLPKPLAKLAMGRGEAGIHEEVILQVEGQTRAYDLRISPLYDQRQHLTGHLTVLRDVSKRKALESSLALEGHRFQQLLAVARATTELPTLQATLRNTLDIAVSLTEAEVGGMFLLDRQGQVNYSVTQQAASQQRDGQGGWERLMQEGLVDRVVQERVLLSIEDIAEDTAWPGSKSSPHKVGAALGIPIMEAGRLIGVLALLHAVPNHFTDQAIEIMTAAVQQMALAIRNARIYEEQRRMVDQQATLYEVLRTLQRPRSPELMARLAVTTIARLTDWPLVALLTPNEKETSLRIDAFAGRLEPDPDWMISLQEDGVFAQAWTTGAVQYEGDLQLSTKSLGQHLDALSLLVLPLKRNEQVQSLFCIASDTPLAFDVDARLLAESLVDVVALGLQSAKLYAALQNELVERHRAEDKLWTTLNKTDALYRVSRALIGTYELPDVLQTVVDGVVTALRADQIVLVILDLQNREVNNFVRGGPIADELAQECYADLMEGIIGKIIQARDPLLLPDDAPEIWNTLPAHGGCLGMPAGSVIAAPLSFRRFPLNGVLVGVNGPEHTPFTRQDLDLITAIGAQISVTIRNARLFHQVAEQQRRLEALVQSSRDGVVLIGMNHDILVINQQALSMLQVEGVPEDWIYHPLTEALDQLRQDAPSVVQVMLDEMRRVVRGDESSGEGEYQIANRVIHWLNLPVLGEAGALGRLIILRDVTEDRLLEKMREDLTHTMVHDLRNPLTGISGSLQLLSNIAPQLSTNYQKLLEVARSSTDRMLTLVNAILDISRLESGRMPLNQTVFSLRDVVHDVLTLQRPWAEQRGITLTSEVPETLPPSWGDAVLISRVLQNLVGNALKFTPEEGTVHVSASISPDQSDKLQVAVSDTGSGISPELQRRLFQKFVTGNQEGKGSGLGLAFCKMVMEAHGERIWVASTLGAGTTFTFTLPTASQAMG